MRNGILKFILICCLLCFICDGCSFALEHEDSDFSKYKQKNIITVENIVFFDSGQMKLRPQSYRFLNELGLYLSAAGMQCVIECYTDEFSFGKSSQECLELSVSRASRIVEYLMQNFAISPDKIRAFGFGDKSPQNQIGNRIDFIIIED